MSAGRSRTALITGAAGAIGTTVAERLTVHFDHVVVTDTDADASRALAERLGPAHLGLALDVTSEHAWIAVVAEIERRFGRIDGLVNNAVFSTGASVVDEDIESWNAQVAVGQTGTWLGMKHVGRLMAANGGGSIVNMCSILSTVAVAHSFAYQAVKGAVRSMTKGAAMHWAADGVRVNSLHPGFIQTPRMLDRMEDPDFHASIMSKIPIGRLGTGDEVAGAVIYLTSDDAAYVTGSEFYLDGGVTAQ